MSFITDTLAYIYHLQDHPADKAEVAKKRRSDVAGPADSGTKAVTPKPDRHKNGADGDARLAKRTKVTEITKD